MISRNFFLTFLKEDTQTKIQNLLNRLLRAFFPELLIDNHLDSKSLKDDLSKKKGYIV